MIQKERAVDRTWIHVDMDADGKTKYILCRVSILHVYVLICHAARKAERNVGEEDDHEEAV